MYNQTVEAYSVTRYLLEDVIEWSNDNVPVYVEKCRQTVSPVVDKVAGAVNDAVVYVKENAPLVADKVST